VSLFINYLSISAINIVIVSVTCWVKYRDNGFISWMSNNYRINEMVRTVATQSSNMQTLPWTSSNAIHNTSVAVLLYLVYT